MPGHTGGIWSGAQGPPPPKQVLGATTYGSAGGGYYVEPFCGEIGVTQGYPMPPTIFNVVVDTVVHHWESLVAETVGGDNSNSNKAVQPAAVRTL